MKITWLGHSSFRIEIAGQVLLLDPFLGDNPSFPDDRRAEALEGVTHILLSHGHGDHVADTVAVAQETGAPVSGMVELMGWLDSKGVENTTGFNKGGTIQIGEVAVTMVHAVHSSSSPDGGYAGGESGFMIAGEGHTIYFTGDTDVMADMKVFNDLHQPDIGLLCSGGHFTMDMRRAAYAAKTFFDFKTVIPCHYKTFPLLEQSAQELIDALPGVNVIEAEVMEPVTI
ncbi:metal-dependent hydrolase [Pseudooceanicola aestuarii]|uniref:metal-dependent hydrolase n=1 Tax=Pseudooceanicola aestuarii TaxID=2697319 RepID=UPI0013D269E5|nr:metal-dependent hydrolase [Pseudooceanicola aestuarii]